MEPLASNKTISVQKLAGVNERAKFGAGELGEFDQLTGFYTPNIGQLKQVPGKKFLQYLDGTPVLRIFQTNDSRQNILIQTTKNLYIMSEADFFNRPIATNLTPVPTTEEEDMSQAVIAHVVAGVNTGGGGTTSNTFVDCPLNQIISQFNADGTAASFAALNAGTGIVTLQTGWYRIWGWSMASDTAGGTPVLCRLLNTGTLTPLWTGLLNENSDQVATVAAGRNIKLEFGGIFHAAAPTTFKVQCKMIGVSRALTGLGNNVAAAGVNDIYRWMSILRTGA